MPLFVVVEKPPKVIVPVSVIVPPMIGHVVAIEVTVPEPLLLNVVQSVEERQPAALPDATVQSIANAPPTAERPAVTVMPFVPETVPVATPNTPVPPLLTRRFEEEG